ncbi:hypothetical protein OJ997_00420 [Solirubrobacter phytolaccae]|uniref:Lipoprotein n=1 Tax=Solirubrobacter phytolaccae TaxID=1404360 RepID=A0A9X3SC49_9ACTN|nr:hypothetical protein [Solirubrobacter phytolaccae]MDA0178742.1 hypothetical protein [Solirubrobacter phytolaccae]
MPLNRLVALLTPVLALAAGGCATWLAQNFPGVNIPQDTLQEIFIAGAVAVLAPALHWLHGWQKWEARDAIAVAAADASDSAHAAAAEEAAVDDDDEDDDWDLDLDHAGLDDDEDALALEAGDEQPAGVA